MIDLNLVFSEILMYTVFKEIFIDIHITIILWDYDNCFDKKL